MRAITASQREKKRVSAKRLRKLLSYDQKTGIFRWLSDRGNGTNSVRPAGAVTIDGRVQISIDSRIYLAHRLACLYMTGRFPREDVDHADGDTLNNAWSNLRQCSRGENLQNKRASKSSNSGLLGVNKHRNSWLAVIGLNGKQIRIGYFKNPMDAHKAYLKAKKKFHKFNPAPRPGAAIYIGSETQGRMK